VPEIKRIIPKYELMKALSELTEAEAAGLTDERTWVRGSIQQRERLVWAAEFGLKTGAGDIVEIGCLHGGTTRLLAPLAQSYGRRVVCVDPWVHLDFYGPEDPFEVFKRAMEPWWDTLDVVRDESQSSAAIDLLQHREICFAFVDGLHTYEACLRDILTVGHTSGFIAVDDLMWNEDLVRAFHEGAGQVKRIAYRHASCREGWLLPR